MSLPRLCIVMPCYNEGVALERTVRIVREKLDECCRAGLIREDSCMLFSDDGSKDNTWEVIQRLYAEAPAVVKAVKLAANRGKEYALYAGLMAGKDLADIVICMDSDLQHDINAVNEFLKKHQEGYSLIYGIKNNRGKEPLYKKVASRCFYALMGRLGSPILPGHTDYSLMSRQVLEALAQYHETNFIFRGTLRSLGFKQCALHFDVLDRQEGVSKFSARKLFNLSLDAITSFSVAPLRWIGLLGFFAFLVSLFMIAWTVFDFFRRDTPNGWATVVCSIWFIGGLLMICLAVVGEYIGKMYMETKRRPRYYVEQQLD